MSTPSSTASADGTAEDGDWVNLPPHDGTTAHVWFFEPKLRFGDVLSKSGLENIANHKYVAGSYTALDTALNPLWVKLTDMLPLWLAPNAVTTVGGLHCGLAYYVLWQHSPNFDQPVPDWVLFLAGYCTIACECYYIHTYIHTYVHVENAECGMQTWSTCKLHVRVLVVSFA